MGRGKPRPVSFEARRCAHAVRYKSNADHAWRACQTLRDQLTARDTRSPDLAIKLASLTPQLFETARCHIWPALAKAGDLAPSDAPQARLDVKVEPHRQTGLRRGWGLRQISCRRTPNHPSPRSGSTATACQPQGVLPDRPAKRCRPYGDGQAQTPPQFHHQPAFARAGLACDHDPLQHCLQCRRPLRLERPCLSVRKADLT